MKALTLTYKHRLRMIGLFLVLFLFLLSACGTQTAAPMEAATPSPPMTTAAAESTSAPVNRVAGTTAESISAAAASRTPVPTPTPGAFDQRIEDFAEAAGLTGNTFLGLTIDDWIDVAFSALIVIVGYLVGTRLVARLPQWINQHTSINLNKFVLKDIGGNLKWLVLLFFVNFAITRLEFLSDEIPHLFR